MANGNFGGGNGTVNNPYLVEDAYDMNAVRNNTSAHYFQTQDIDLSMFDPWIPIGFQGQQYRPFEGSFNGNNKKISHLKCSIIDSYGRMQVGLFLHLMNCSVKNVNLTNVVIDTKQSDSVLDDVSGCLASVADDSEITNCHIQGSIEGHWNTGGLIGECSKSSIKECSFEGHVYGKISVGGLIGRSFNCDIQNSFTQGEVLYKTFIAGGLIGGCQNVGLGRVINCYAATSVQRTVNLSHDRAGGLIGELTNSNISNNIVNCYYDKNLANLTDTGKGTPKSTFEMKLKNTFKNWRFDGDFDAVWTIRELYEYPKYIPFMTLRFLSKNSINEKIDFNYWQTNISIDSRPYQNFNHFRNDDERSITVWIRKNNVHVKVTVKKTGFEIPDWDMTVKQNTEIIVTAQPYNYAQQQTYYLSTAQDLLNMSDPFGNYVLTSDIDFDGIDYLTPFSSTPFLGDFDGKNKVIKNLMVKSNVNGDFNGVGIIGYGINATIKNVVLETSTVTDSTKSFGAPAAFICGKMEQKIIDEYQPTNNRLMNMTNCRIKDCQLNYNDATFTTTGVFVGEVVTQQGALDVLDLSDYTMFSKIRSTNVMCNLHGGRNIGGLLGKITIATNTSSNIELTVADDVELFTTMDFNNTDCVWVSGMFAEAIFNANIKLHKVGANTTIKNVLINFATGGLFGQSVFNRDVVNMENWYADTVLDNVTINSGFGGLTGVWEQASNTNNITLDKGYIATNTDIASSQPQGIGLFHGYTNMVNQPNFIDVFADKDVNAMATNNEPLWMLKTTAEMKTKTTFTNFDFEEIWIIEAGNYPKFTLLKERVIKLCQRTPLTNFRGR